MDAGDFARVVGEVEPGAEADLDDVPSESLGDALARLEDMGTVALYDALAERLDVPVDNLATGGGSVAVLYHLVQAMCAEGDEVVYAWRSFEAYPIAVGLTGATSAAYRDCTIARLLSVLLDQSR